MYRSDLKIAKFVGFNEAVQSRNYVALNEIGSTKLESANARVCASLARMQQEPLTEILMLWNPEGNFADNELLTKYKTHKHTALL